MTRPLVGRSIPVNIFRSVDFPLPDGPLIAKRLPLGTEKVTSSKMTVFLVRDPMARERCSTWTNGGGEERSKAENSICWRSFFTILVLARLKTSIKVLPQV